jgi:HD-GYP domain-containing protein (c-di-GMP phosphodiesterase class II)
MSRIARTMVIVVGATALTIVLAAAVVFVNPLAALAPISVCLMGATLIAVRRTRAESRRADAYLTNARDKYDAVIASLCGALELEDDMRASHVARVRHLAGVVAAEMGMRKDDISLLQKAAILADTGKIEIAQGILNKPGELNEAEWAEMKKHPEFGYNFLASIRPLRDASEIVLAHHERYDGQGYPRGLKGDAIPLSARIFTIVDAYTAMTSDRPHRKKISHEVAVKEILRNSLTQFDPEVVRAFVRCEERGQIVDPERVEAPRAAPAAPETTDPIASAA